MAELHDITAEGDFFKIRGLDNQLIDPGEEIGSVAGKIECRERLGGLLKYYYRDAA
ncbi:hypothetical protein [Polystyrenella longa]|uniref:hypothetical protein n=1 Tax=Polystyrenella longa TaxID=2528007 RepID=UPI0018D1F84C|nr:hypothetical protein [Polystyrenella longa]